MKFPLISEYVEAVKNAEDTFGTLTNLRPIMDEDCNPVMTSGNFAVVFKMRDEKKDKLYAVKCFLKDQPNRAENYRMIAEELEYVSSSFLTKFQYLDNELFVDSANADGDEFPVLLMDWVDGMNLDQYIRQHIDETYQLHLLAYQFSRLALWLMPQPFAHGDLKPDNIMVREDGTLVLIDYDGMFVPSMKGQKAREMGSPDFRHPARTEDTFNEHIDDFSLASILLSLRTIAEEPSLLDKYGAADRLLFSENDYRDIHSCQLLKELFPSECAEVNTLIGLFIIALTQSDLSNVSFRLLSLERPKEPEIEIISTEVTEEDKKGAWTDEFGVEYSKDGKKLLTCTNRSLTDYSIRRGSKSICDQAFLWQCSSLQSVTIPDSVTSIGDSAFSCCSSLQSVTIPDSVTSIGGRAFGECSSLQSVTIPDSVTSIGDRAFSWCTFSWCTSLQSVTIPDSVTSIDESAFSWCTSLQSVIIPDSVTSIGDRAFWGCTSLQSVIIPDSVTSIGNKAFSDCKSLQSVTIPDSVTSISDSAFSGCSSLQSVTIPDSVTSIGRRAFSKCSSLQSVTIPDSVTSIGRWAFLKCSSLQSVTIPDSVTSIGAGAFSGCSSLHSFTIPDSVTSINGNPFFSCPARIINYSKHFVIVENNLYTSDKRKLISYLSKENHFIIPDSVTSIGAMAFFACSSLQSVAIPGSVTSIGTGAFTWCSSLQSVTIPGSVTSIGNVAFWGCSSLQSVTIPDSVTSIGNEAFSHCSSLQSVIIPDSVTSIGNKAFSDCKSLQSVTIPDSVTSIGDGAFLSCESLRSVFISRKTYSRLDNSLQKYSSKIKFTD